MAEISKITLPNGEAYDIRAGAIPYGQVDSTSTSTAYTATVPGISELVDGVCVLLKNGVVTSESGFTININGLGAKRVYSNMAAATAETTLFNVNYTLLFIYDSTRATGGAWIAYRGYYSDSNSIGYQLRTNSTVLKTTDRTRYYRILFTSADGTHWVPANTQYDNSATSAKTVNQRPIDPFGRIVYMTGTTNFAAEANVTATVVWDQYTITLGYSFNRTGEALELTAQTPVYVKCAPQSDGSAIIDSTTPIVQNLPTIEDGKIYIFLGIAYDATHVELVNEHPIYYYKGGSIRRWVNAYEQTIPTNVSAFNNDAGYLTSYTETDPTVPSWAKASTKPSYTASEVGAATDTHVHGNITNGGDITTNVAIASGDRLVINDESASKVNNSSITFGSSTTQYLANNGTWQNVPSVPSRYNASTNPNGYLTMADLPIWDGSVT